MGVLFEGIGARRSELEVFRATCPHCQTKGVAFIPSNKAVAGWRSRVAVNCLDVLAQCGLCSRGIVAVYKNDGTRHNPYYTRTGEIFPKPPSFGAPLYTPEPASNYFDQGAQNLFESKNYDSAGVMFRKSLESGLKERFPRYQGSLFERIKSAAEDQKLTPDIAEWAHTVRVLGNKAAHDEKWTKEQAIELYHFTDLLFIYLFTLPAKIRESRKNHKAQQGSPFTPH